jgi:hypothetical protein
MLGIKNGFVVTDFDDISVKCKFKIILLAISF